MKPLIVANWKMNPKTLKEAKTIFSFLERGIKTIKKAGIVLCPPFLYIPSFNPKNSNLALGAQDCFFENEGAFTGEISPFQLKDLKCRYVILGHSERRKHLKEGSEIINEKVKKALEAGLAPILCIGESLEQREGNKTIEVLKEQIKQSLKGISKKKLKKLIIAYEPVWAIGTGNPCPVSEAQSMGLLVKKTLSDSYGKALSEEIKILYGGSVDSENAFFYIKEALFDGLLVGGASLDPKEFLKIVRSVC